MQALPKMCNFFLLVLFILFVEVDVRPDTRVYNAKALSPSGKYDLNIQVIQVKLLNWTPENEPNYPPPTTPASSQSQEVKRLLQPTISRQRSMKIQANHEPPFHDPNQPQYSANTVLGHVPTNSDTAESFVFLILAVSLGIVLVLSMTYMILTVRSYRKKPKLTRSFSLIYHNRPMELEEFYYQTRATPIHNKRPYLPPPMPTGPPPELPPRMNRPTPSRSHHSRQQQAAPLLPKFPKFDDDEDSGIHMSSLTSKKTYLNHPDSKPSLKTRRGSF